MNEYRHHVSGIFANREEAQSAFSSLIEKGLLKERLQIFDTGSELPIATQETRSNEVLKDMVVDGTIGTAVGTGIGGLAGVALIAANVSLFVASPLLAPLALLGWGASLGGLAGATVGSKVSSENKEGWFSDLIRDAITNGQAVLVAETRTKQETAIAREVIQISVGNVKDVNAA
ncbi:MAG: hypothetical protein Q8M10_11110 [Methylotenera sp.]|uniref:hypothetical protein n=1 Tax=Methylotenera sp. TaxID=2051956 RepID=UPI0027307695|nr:hypothetical protein [Methylotenera sp.]MDP1523698.1 hypothetical protein [Methylotenera sp.]